MRASTATAFAALAAVLAAAPASAQFDPSIVSGLSAGCGSALVGLISNRDVASCISLTSAIGAFTSNGDGSLVPAVGSYFRQNICPNAPCSNATLGSTLGSVGPACQSDVQNGAALPSVILFLLQNYDLVRTLACFEDSRDKQLCLIKDLYAVQNVTGQPLTFDTLTSLLTNETATQSALSGLASNRTLACTDCNDALLTTLRTGMSSSSASSASQSLAPLYQQVTQTCGANFTDSTIPASVNQLAKGNSSNPNSGSTSGSGSTGSSGGNQNAAQSNSAAFGLAGASALLVAGIAALL